MRPRNTSLALQSAPAPRGILAFTALPVELAWATLERVEADGPGAKVSRLQVGAIVAALDRRLSKGEPRGPRAGAGDSGR